MQFPIQLRSVIRFHDARVVQGSFDRHVVDVQFRRELLVAQSRVFDFQIQASLHDGDMLRWIKEVEIPAIPDFDGKEIDEREIMPGRVIGLQVLCDIALGDEEKSRVYFDELRRRARDG